MQGWQSNNHGHNHGKYAETNNRFYLQLMPEASNPNSHGYIHGKGAAHFYNAGGVEESHINKYSSLNPTLCSFSILINSSLYEVVL